MARKGSSNIIRSLNAPSFWRIQKKEFPYAAKAVPGPHPAENCFTLLYVLRDLLKLVSNATEAKKVLISGQVLVDGKARKDMHFPVGLMDVIEIPTIKKTFRVLPDKAYNLKLVEITKDEGYKLCKILGKIFQPGGNVQLNLHDGRSLVVKVKDPNKPKEAAVYTTGDVVKIDLKTGEIAAHVKESEGKLAVVVAGNNNGRSGKITKITKIIKNDIVTLDDKGETFETKLEYLFVLGDSKPAIAIDL
jgi:small subunit ribosomal protein S4e